MLLRRKALIHPCSLSVVINNNTSATLIGMAWSFVDANGLGSNLDFAIFEATAQERRGSRIVRRQRVSVQPLSTEEVHFQFNVPSFLRNGATFCTRMFFGLRPAPLVNTAREGFLFCIDKGASGFQVMDATASQALFGSISGRGRIYPKPPSDTRN